MNLDLIVSTNMSTSVSVIWHYGIGVVSLLCLLCGSLTNCLVIFVFVRNSRLRQPSNFLLINLAVTDLGLLVTNNTLHVIASFNEYWPFGQIGCNFYAFTGGLCGLTSIATMAAIALTRLMAVIDPFSSLKLTTQFTFKCIVCSWMYGLIWMIGPLFGWNRFVFEGFGTSCTFDYVSKDRWNRSFMLVLIIGGFLIPLTIIIVSYTIILMKLSKRGRSLKYFNDTDDSPYKQVKQGIIYCFIPLHSLNNEISQDKVKSVLELGENKHMKQVFRRTEVRATRMALLICGIYCLAWTPYALMTILSQFGPSHLINMYTTSITGLFAKIAACIDPFIYALSSSTFRQHIYFYLRFRFLFRREPLPPSSSYYSLQRKYLTPTLNRRLIPEH
ncbi:hypothetical protein I4U23_029196 [Adineta vaga]|nr:hypothetical protein I4U23_029196 [Adineta vaga]